MVCLIKNKLNKAKINHLATIVGSEEAAYYLLATNNGYTLDKTPTGGPSALFAALLESTGSEKEAVLSKAIAYTPQFFEQHGDWTSVENGSVVEPSIKDITGEYITNGPALGEVLEDSGEFVQMCQALEDANILDHSLAVVAAVGHARDKYAAQYLKNWLKDHPDSNEYEKKSTEFIAKSKWNIEKVLSLMGKTQEKLAEKFGLIKTIEDGKVVYKSSSNKPEDQFRVEFVNSLTTGEYASEDGTIRKGVFDSKLHADGMLSFIQISLQDGDPSTFIHELGHSYVRKFWNSNTVQRALRVIDAETPGRLTPKDLEEILVELITDKVVNGKSKALKFFEGLRKLGKLLTFGMAFKDRLEIRDLITSYFLVNRDLSYDEAELITYAMYKGPMYSSKRNVSEKDVFENIVNGLKRKIKALKASDASQSLIIRASQALHRAESRNPMQSGDVQKTVEDFLNLAIDEVCEAENYLSDILLNGISSLNPKQFMDLLNNVVRYYQVTLNEYINPLTYKTIYLLQGSTLYIQYQQILQMVNRISSMYNNILSQYVDKMIEDFVDLNVDVGDKERIKQNMKYWVGNEIDDGRLQVGELFVGGTTSSRSPIVRMVEYMVSSANTLVRIETNSLGHKLLALYDKCKPAVSFSNFMKTFIETDSKGKPTGYFLRDINYGQFYQDKLKFIEKLDAKYNVTITLDERNNEVREWPSDQAWKDYQDELDDWIEAHANRKYTAEYYKDRRLFLSRDTIQELDSIQDRINEIEKKCTDPVTGIPFTFELSVEDRLELAKLRRDKELLANPYIIVQDQQGNITSIQEKTGDALRMAEEIALYKKATAKKRKYAPNTAKYQLVYDYIEQKYGVDSIEMSRFKYDYLSTKINPELWDLVGRIEITDAAVLVEVTKLQAKRRAIIDICYDKKGEWVQPNLNRLNEQAFREIKKIDERIAFLTSSNKQYAAGQLEYDQVFAQYPVMYDENTTYIQYLENKAVQESQHNPNALRQFYDLYFKKSSKGGDIPISVFSYIGPAHKITNTGSRLIKSIIDSPIGAFNEIQDDSYYINPDWDKNDATSVLPLRKDRNTGKILYDNSEQYNKVMQDPDRKAFYDAILDAMDLAYKKLPHYHERAKYLMPQIADKDLGRMAGGWRDIVAAFTKWGGIDDDVEINNSQTMRPDGSPINMIPIRWNRLNKNIKLNTDILYTVIAFSKMASEYLQKSEIAPYIEALILESRNNPIGRDAQSDQTKKLEDYADMQLYGNIKKPLTKDRYGDIAGDVERRISLLFGGILEIAHMKLMSHNFRAVLKNLLDSTLTAVAEISGGKHFTTKDFLCGTSYAFKDILKAILGIGTGNTKSKLAAAMLFTGAAESVDSIFLHQYNSRIYRLFKRFFCMGEYTLVDYLVKGVITAMAFHHSRLIQNPLTGKNEFMTQDQARYAYTQAGLSADEGSKIWSTANTTLWDAYDINENGEFVLDKKYEDIVRPINPTTGKRSNKIETRIAGTIRERGSVINGILDSANKGGFSRNYLGAAFMLMRGWMVSHFVDYFKDGHDFAEYVDAADSKKNIKRKVRESNQLVLESEDFAYRGQYNFETGTLERGVYKGIAKAYGRWASGITHLNRLLNTEKLTDNERYQVRRLNAVLAGMALSILLTVITGKKLEDDKDDKALNYAYTVAVATVSERATTLPGVQLLTTLDVIRTPFIAYTLIQDAESVLNLIADGYEAATYDGSYDAEYNNIVNRGTYKGMETWKRDALKTNAQIYPYVNINNIYRSVSPESNKSSANYYRQIFPTSWLAYKPKINEKDKKQDQGVIADMRDYISNTTQR